MIALSTCRDPWNWFLSRRLCSWICLCSKSWSSWLGVILAFMVIVKRWWGRTFTATSRPDRRDRYPRTMSGPRRQVRRKFTLHSRHGRHSQEPHEAGHEAQRNCKNYSKTTKTRTQRLDFLRRKQKQTAEPKWLKFLPLKIIIFVLLSKKHKPHQKQRPLLWPRRASLVQSLFRVKSVKSSVSQWPANILEWPVFLTKKSTTSPSSSLRSFLTAAAMEPASGGSKTRRGP